MKKVLILKLGALGDLLISIPYVNKIITHHPNDAIYLLTSDTYPNIFETWDHILTIQRMSRHGKKSFFSMLRWIRQERFSVLYDLQMTDRTALLSICSGIPKRIGDRKYFHTHHPIEKDDQSEHVANRIEKILLSGGVSIAHTKPIHTLLKNSDKEIALQWIQTHNPQKLPMVLLHAGSSIKRQAFRWPLFGDLAKKILEHNHLPIWIGSDADTGVNTKLSHQYGGINSTDAFTPFQVLALAKHAQFAVTNDSAPMHLLAYSERNVYAIFRYERLKNIERWQRSHAIGQKEHVITGSSNQYPDWPSLEKVMHTIGPQLQNKTKYLV